MSFPLPFSVKTLNPVYVDIWRGPFNGANETAAKTAANTFIPSGVRLQGREVVLIFGGAAHIYWYKNGILDTDLIPQEADVLTETDPTVPSHVKAITTTNISNWNTAFGWGNPSGVYIPLSQKGAASGVAPLNSSSKIDDIYLPDSVLGQVEYKGLYNAATNTPALATPSVSNKGWYYVVSVAGGIYDVGDWAICDGTAWGKVDNSDALTSFNGRVGNITLLSSDVTTALGYTPVTNARTLTINGTTFDLTANRSWTVGDVRIDGTYSNPTWLTSVSWSKISSTPTTLSEYGISDAYTQTQINNFFSGTSAITGYNNSNWNTAFNQTRQWDGGSTGLTAATGRTSLGATTVGSNIFTLTNPSAISFIRLNADNTISALDAASFRTAIGAGTSTVTAAALTKVDDTNVTLTLGGTPSTALLQAASITVGWTGTLADSRIASAATWNAKESAITSGTTAQYWRGDKTWQTLNTTNVSEGSNLYYTEGRVNANTNVAANTAARHNAVTIGTANGLSLSTQAISLAAASTSTTGALTSTDWNTFNGKENALTFSTGLTRTGNTITNTITQYTDALARASHSFAAGSGAYNSTTGVITIPTNTNQLTNGAGYITGITSGNVTTALGFTPYNSTNPSGFISTNQNITLSGVVTGSGTTAITTSIASGAITNAMLANGAVANLSGTNTGDNAVNSLYSGLVSNATHTGDATGATVLTLATVNSNIGTFNNLTVNAKGLVTAASNVSYSPLAGSSSITTVGTLASGSIPYSLLTGTPNLGLYLPLSAGISNIITGSVYMANNQFYYQRNAANTANIITIGLDNNNKVRIDPSAVGTEVGGTLSVTGGIIQGNIWTLSTNGASNKATYSAAGGHIFSQNIQGTTATFLSGSASTEALIVGGAGGVGSTSQGQIKFGDFGTVYKIQAGQDYGAMNFIIGSTTVLGLGSTGAITASSNMSIGGTLGVTGNTTISTLTAPVNTTNSQIQTGSIEVQSYGVNNAWVGDNLYFNGSAFKYRQTGFASQLYFRNTGAIDFFTAPSGAAGADATMTQRLSIANSGAITFSGNTTIGGTLGVTGAITAGAGQGFQNADFQPGYNRIWSFGNISQAYGLAYYQGLNTNIGTDAIGFHFGDINNPSFFVRNSGEAKFNSNVIATRYISTDMSPQSSGSINPVSMNASTGALEYLSVNQTQTFLGINTGATLTNSISGNSSTSTNWGGHPANFNVNPSTAIQVIAAWNATDNQFRSATPAQVAAFISGQNFNTTGNAATATNLITNRTNWNTNGTITAVVGELAWKNYGNSHTIFDASSGISPSGGGVSNTNCTVPWSPTYPTLMGWNGSTSYGVRVDVSRYSESSGGVAWTNVSSRPTALSQFTNDLGNYGGWITGINASMVNAVGTITNSTTGNAATATNVAWTGITGRSGSSSNTIQATSGAEITAGANISISGGVISASGGASVSSGTYTPTYTGTANVSAVSAPQAATYTIVGNVVTVYFSVLVTPTSSATATSFSINYPVTSEGKSIGSGASNNISNQVSCIIQSVSPSSTTAIISFRSTATVPVQFNGSFSYLATFL